MPTVRSINSHAPAVREGCRFDETIIAAVIEVHRDKGPGLIESIYEWCLLKELELRGLKCVSQKCVPIEYKGFRREEPLRFDVLGRKLCPHRSKRGGQSPADPQGPALELYEALSIPVGLLINFHEGKVTDGVSGLILPGANR